MKNNNTLIGAVVVFLCVAACAAVVVYVVSVAGCGRKVPEGEFRIEGRLSRQVDGTPIVLSEWKGNTSREIARDTVRRGRFSFELPVGEGGARLSVSGIFDGMYSVGREIWAEPGVGISIVGRNPLSYTWDVESPVERQTESDRYMLHSKELYDRKQELFVRMTRSGGVADEETRREMMALDEELGLAILRGNVEVMKQAPAEAPVSDIWIEKLSATAQMLDWYESYASLRGDLRELWERLSPEQRELPEMRFIRPILFPEED